MKSIPYASDVESIMYAQVCTHPDLAFITGLLGRFQYKSRMKHWKAIKEVLCYMPETKHYMLTYKRTDNLEVIAYSDADFTGCADSQKSTSSYIFTLASGAISWRNYKQMITTTSSMMYAKFIECYEAYYEHDDHLPGVDERHALAIPPMIHVYLFDDIHIYSSSWSKHLCHIKLVLAKLQEHHLFIKCSKCLLGESLMAYLGHVISANGVTMDEQKIQAVLDWPLPRSVRSVWVFLGLAGYYHRFIKNYGTIAMPLTALLKKDVFKWSTEAEAAFWALQHELTTAPILQLLDFNRDFVMECVVSGTGLGVVLHQGDRPVAFFSRQLVPRHTMLAAYERELITLV
jgi:hypothetical protein